MTQTAAGPPRHAAALNENHARRIASTFAYVDNLLQNIERAAHARPSPFSREQADLTETESRLLLSLVETARSRMLATLDHLAIARPAANLSARWSATTAFRFIDIALSELTPETLVGYGPVDEDSAAEVSAVASELRDVIARGRELLQPHEGEKLHERVAKIGGPVGEILRAAEALSTSLGLAEVRALIAAAADRTTTNTIDVGIFGRVSSGKSSLINALVGAPVLPVGATPVTAVPLRLVHGPETIRVLFAHGRDEEIDASRLPEFATEAGNRDNARHVRSILIQTPRLPDGLALLDTPGVGSLSQSGPAQAFAWLPRCDLGVVLVAAGTPLGRDELALVSGLTHAGIAVEVLLSKSDLLSEPERAAALAYVESEVQRATGRTDVPVRPVSVVPAARPLLDRWRDDELGPMIAARQQVADAALSRRLHALVGALNAAVRGRPALERATVDLHRARLAAQHEVGAAADELEASARPSLAHAADAAVAAWRAGTDARAEVRQALLDAPNHALTRVRGAGGRLLERAGAPDLDDAASRLPPLFDPSFLDALPIAERAGVVGGLFARSHAERQLAPIARLLDDAYGTYANRVRAWGLERLDEQFERITASRDESTGQLAPELRPLAALVDEHFPPINS